MCGLSHYFSIVTAPPPQLRHQNEPSDRPLDWMDHSCVHMWHLVHYILSS